MFTFLYRSVLVVSALAMPVAVWAAEPLAFHTALQTAEAQSQRAAAGRWQASAARDMAVAAGQLPDPVLKLGINNLPLNGEDRLSLGRDFMTMRSAGVMQEFTRQDKRQARRQRFEKEAEAADAARAQTLASVRSSTAIAWLECYYQERMRALLLRQQAEARLQIDAADAAYRGGRGRQSEVFAARAALAQMDDQVAQADQQLTAAQTQLARWVGAIAADGVGDLPAMDHVDWDEVTLEAQLQHHPQITAIQKLEEMAQADADLARANQRADWSAELMLSQRGSAYSNMVSINVSVPLQWDAPNRQNRELSAKLATVAQMQAERENAQRSQAAEVRAMLQDWHSDQARLLRYSNVAVPLAVERTLASLSAYRGGASGTLTAVLEARRAEIDVRMAQLRLEMDTARLWAQLNFLAATPR